MIKMKKKTIIISIVVIVFIATIILADKYYPSNQEIYERNIKFLESRKKLCESAEFIYEQEGEFTNPKEIEKQKGFFSIINHTSESERVYARCYELRNNVKIYQNWNNMKYIE